MDKDRMKGKMEDVAGRAERQVGEWTGDKKMQAEGLKKQAKGKTRNAIGQVKDAGRDLINRTDDARLDREAEMDREKKEDKAA